MEAKELRIGNWVIGATGEVQEVAYVGETIGLHNKIGGTDKYQKMPIISFDIDHLKPIPLSPEILRKLGFEPKGSLNEYTKRRDEWIVYTCRWNSITKSVTSFGVVMLDARKRDIGCANFAWNIETLHRLQNIWFDCTGENITINL